MAYTHKELKHKTVAQLRTIAEEIQHDAVQGYTTMNKDHLIAAICTALDIPQHEHHDVVGVDKQSIKQKIRQLKKERDEAENAKDREKLTASRKEIKDLKNRLRKATV